MNRKWQCLIWLSISGLLLAGCAQTLNMQAEAQLSQKNYDVAIAQFQEYLKQNPEDYQARGRLGAAYLGKGDTITAIETLRKVLKQVPGDPQATLHLGLALLQAGDKAAAMNVWRAYQNPQQPLVYQEIQRQLTLLDMIEGRELAKKALAAEKQLQTPKATPGTLAVLPYSDLPPDVTLRPLQKGLASMIVTDLAAIKSLQVIERLRLQALLDEMKLGMSGFVAENTAPRFGKLVGAEHLVAGTMASKTQVLRVNSSIASTLKKDMVGSFGVDGEIAKFFTIEKEVVAQIIKTLKLSPTPQEKDAIEKVHTKNLQAFICYGQGLDSLDEGRWQQAMEYFSCAVREDPQFILAINALLSCPKDTTPTLASLLAQSPGQFSALVRSAIEAASSEQVSADTRRAEAQTSEEKGDGGGGGGGGH